MDLHDLTTIGRSIDLDVPGNRAIVAVTASVTVGGTAWQLMSQVPWLKSALWGAQAGLSVFLAWVLCRELDPDHSRAALVASSFAMLALFIRGLPRLDVAFWMVVMLRVVNRSTGLPAGVLDALGLLGLASWLAMQGNWFLGLVTGLAFFLDSQLPAPRRLHFLFGCLALIVTLVTGTRGYGAAGQGALSLAGGLAALTLSFAFVPVMVAARSVESLGDQSGQRLAPIRVQAAQAMAVLYGIGFALLEGPSGIAALAPLWAATVGASVTWLVNVLLP